MAVRRVVSELPKVLPVRLQELVTALETRLDKVGIDLDGVTLILYSNDLQPKDIRAAATEEARKLGYAFRWTTQGLDRDGYARFIRCTFLIGLLD